MKTKTQYLAVMMSALLLLTGAAMAQNSSNTTTNDNFTDNTSTEENQLGDGVRSYNFDLQGLPAQAALEGSENSAEQDDVERTDEPVVRLSGFIEFNTGGYEVETETEEEDGTVNFTVTLEEPQGPATQQITRVPVEENVEVDSGNYTANLEVVRDGETVLERTQEVNVPETENEAEQDPENMTRSELIQEVKDLREQLRELQGESEEDERQGPPEDVPANPGNDDESEENESEDSNENESQGPPTEAPGQGNSNRPGFVNNFLNSLFGR